MQVAPQHAQKVGAAIVLCCLSLVGCSGSAASDAPSLSSMIAIPHNSDGSTLPSGSTSPSKSALPSRSTSPSKSVLPTSSLGTVLHPPVVSGVTWQDVGRSVHGKSAVAVARVDAGRVSLMWLDASLLSFRFVPGYAYPENSPILPVDRRPSTWDRELVAGFNGGFHLKDGAGGYYYNRTTVRSLRPGLAAFTVSSTGQLRVGVWGSDLTLGPTTTVVRENLRPLVLGGVSQASVSDSPSAWGLANGGLPHANRSALGQLADGSLVFAYGSEVTAAAMAQSFALVGVRTAVMLDMNKSWPTGYYYDAPASGHLPAGHRIHPGIWRNPSTYYSQFSKDFVVALAR